MSDWTVTGSLNSTGIEAMLEWRDGGLTGSPEALAVVAELLASGRSIALTPTGPFIPADPSTSVGALVIARDSFRRYSVSGDPPALPTWDDGLTAEQRQNVVFAPPGDES